MLHAIYKFINAKIKPFCILDYLIITVYIGIVDIYLR